MSYSYSSFATVANGKIINIATIATTLCRPKYDLDVETTNNVEAKDKEWQIEAW